MSTSKSPSEIDGQPDSELEFGLETIRTTDVVPSAAELAASGALDSLFEQIDAGKLQLSGTGGLIPELIKGVLERGLQAEMTSHLGYEMSDPAAGMFENHRNGSSEKTVLSEAGNVLLSVPRDRQGTFTPRLVPKGRRRLGGLDEMIVSLYAGGMTIRDIQHHLASTIGTELSHETISKITDEILDEVLAWQTRPLEALYPVIYLDALVVKVKDGVHVKNKAAHIAVGVDMVGVKHVLGIWIQASEGAKFWGGVCAELSNRGIKDVLILCCDGLAGLPEAIAATWPLATVQTCVVHLIRAAMRFVAYQDRKRVAAALKPIYTAVNAEAALAALEAFEGSELGRKYPTAIRTFRDAWERFTPFLAFPSELRRVIYTTNAIESLNYQLRKIIKNRGHFPNDTAAVKLLWLAICNIEDKRAREREKERRNRQPGDPKRSLAGKLIQGATDDETEQYLVAALLRPGNAGNEQVLSFLTGVIENVRAHFPRAQVTLRADAGFAIPSVFEYLDDHQVRYAIGMSSNSVLKEHAEPGMAIARALSEASGTSERVYVDKQYETKRSWPHSRRVIIKAEVTRYPGRTPRDNARFVVTDLVGDAAFVYESVYSRRGDVENRIKELKNAIRMDKTSCTNFAANQLRVILHAMAFALYQEIRLAATGTTFASAQVTTIRERLIKLGAWFKTSTRRIVIHLPQAAPWRNEWVTIARRLAAPPA